MRNAGLEEAQAGLKIAGRSINNLRYADDTTLMAESEEELKSLLVKVFLLNQNAYTVHVPQERRAFADSDFHVWDLQTEVPGMSSVAREDTVDTWGTACTHLCPQP